MTHQVALRTDAYTALREARKSNESFSDVVLRLLQENASSTKDPFAFTRARLKRTLTPAQHLRTVEEGRAAWSAREARQRGL